MVLLVRVTRPYQATCDVSHRNDTSGDHQQGVGGLGPWGGALMQVQVALRVKGVELQPGSPQNHRQVNTQRLYIITTSFSLSLFFSYWNFPVCGEHN